MHSSWNLSLQASSCLALALLPCSSLGKVRHIVRTKKLILWLVVQPSKYRPASSAPVRKASFVPLEVVTGLRRREERRPAHT